MGRNALIHAIPSIMVQSQRSKGDLSSDNCVSSLFYSIVLMVRTPPTVIFIHHGEVPIYVVLIS
jgi:hypothetical protein